MKLTFLGATGTVTGSRFLVDSSSGRVLVDCGLFQGIKAIRRRNWDPFPVDPGSIDAVVVTHAHIDHTGYLPALARDGFGGDIWCTRGTAALCRLLLPDAAYLQEEDARLANKRGSSRHDPALPLYTGADAELALSLLRVIGLGTDFAPAPDVIARFSPVGHILGAACVRLQDETGSSVLFTGDVGRPDDPIMRPPAPPPSADHVVTESTYGDRVHARADSADQLADIVGTTVGRGGTVLIPTFAVGRAQLLLHLLSRLRRGGRIPDVPTYLDSPMAVNATELFRAHPDAHRLSTTESSEMSDDVQYVRTPDESKHLTRSSAPAIILSASGMATGGRVLHHLAHLAPDPANTILFVGYQAAGTRGRAMLAGADRIKMFGTQVPVRAEIVKIDGLSAHADARELTAWLGACSPPPHTAFIVHGEPQAADALRRSLRDDLGWQTHVPEFGDEVALPAGRPALAPAPATDRAYAPPASSA